MRKVLRVLANTAGLLFLLGMVLGAIATSGQAPDTTESVHSTKLAK